MTWTAPAPHHPWGLNYSHRTPRDLYVDYRRPTRQMAPPDTGIGPQTGLRSIEDLISCRGFTFVSVTLSLGTLVQEL